MAHMKKFILMASLTLYPTLALAPVAFSQQRLQPTRQACKGSVFGSVQFGKCLSVSIQVVQTETRNAVITHSSAFASAFGHFGNANGSSESVEVSQLVGEDVVLNGQKVRLHCDMHRCHPMNPGQYDAVLHGAEIETTSYGQKWNNHQEKLVQVTYRECWKILGAWQGQAVPKQN
jgi:hypothetical protein